MNDKQKKDKLAPNFTPVWAEDIDHLEYIPRTALLIYFILNIKKNYETRKVKASNTMIAKWVRVTRKTVRVHMRKLIELGYLIRVSNYTYYIVDISQVEPKKWVKTTHQTVENPVENENKVGKNYPQ